MRHVCVQMKTLTVLMQKSNYVSTNLSSAYQDGYKELFRHNPGLMKTLLNPLWVVQSSNELFTMITLLSLLFYEIWRSLRKYMIKKFLWNESRIKVILNH